MPIPWPSSLPSDVTWRYDAFFKHHWLRMDHCDIAQVTPVAVGTGWLVYVNRHWGIRRKSVGGKAPTAEFGKKMVDRWLWANLARLRREVAAIPRPRTATGEPVGPDVPQAPPVPAVARPAAPRPDYGPPPTPEEMIELQRKENRRRRGKKRR